MIESIAIWWLTIQLFGLLGLPLTQWLFRALPDRGYAFSKSLGLLLAGYLAWLLAMLGLAPFGRALVLLCALAVGALGLLVAYKPRPRNQPPGADGWLASPRAWLGQHWRMVLAYEAIFTIAFLALLRLRGYDYQILVGPNPYGTERPMDYALFNAIRASSSFPPHDPWLSGFSINYYYFGYLLMAVVSLASGIAEGTAYNLSLALIFALTALGVAGIVLNLIGLTTKDDRRPEPALSEAEGTNHRSDQAPRLFAVRPIGAALLAIVLVLGVGNQGGALQVISGVKMILALDGPSMARALANGLGARQPLTLDPPFRGYDYEGTSQIVPDNRAADFDWWSPSRALWDAYPPAPEDADRRPSRYYTITEFPFFSFWLGDMHPHVMALPFGLLALALALQTAARPTAPNYTMGWRGWAELALTGIVMGSLYLINSWDLPTYVLLYLGALLLLYVRLGTGDKGRGIESGEHSIPSPHPLSPISRIWWRHYFNQAITALLAAVVLFVPFHLTFRSLVGGRGFPLGLVTSARTPWYSFVIIFGLFMAPLLVFVFSQPRGDSQQPAASGQALGVAQPLARPGALARYAPWLVLLVFVAGALAGFALLALLALAFYAAWLAARQAGARPGLAFALWALALGCLVCFGTEIVYIRDVFEGSSARMNTIFKFYYQLWLLWGVLAAYALWWLLARRPTTDDRQPTTAKRSRGLAVGGLWFVVLVTLFSLFLAGALVYPWLTLGAASKAPWVGIAGITPREKTPDGLAGINWLRANTPSDAVILEAVGDSYDSGYSGLGFGQVSGSTGRATVLGWPGHEDQWRGGDPQALAQIRPRREGVTAIYSDTDTLKAAELLKNYGVDYIYVGAAERATYPAEGLAKLSQLGDIVFEQGEVVIYKVKN